MSVGGKIMHRKRDSVVAVHADNIPSYLHNSCGHCQECLRGNETYCPERAMYAMANTDQGSFASHAVWREAYLFKIPDSLSDEAAAPLMVSFMRLFPSRLGKC